MLIGTTCFLGDGFGASPVLLASSLAPLHPFADASEFFQAEKRVRMGCDNRFRDAVIDLQFQPSLSPAERDQSPRRGASAFLLQAFVQPGVVVSFRPDAFAGIEPASVRQRSRRCQVALPDIYPHHRRQHTRGWLSNLQFQGDQQVKLLVGFVIPELGTSNGSTVVDESHMPLIALVRDDDTALQAEYTHLLSWLEGVVVAVVVGHSWRDILGRFVQPLVAFLGVACLAMLDILLELGP